MEDLAKFGTDASAVIIVLYVSHFHVHVVGATDHNLTPCALLICSK